MGTNSEVFVSGIPVTIRKAVPEDGILIKQLIDFCAFKADGSGQLIPLSEAEILGLIRGRAFYIAEASGNLVGCASIAEYSINNCKPIAELRSLVVSPEFRRQGIGKWLVEACISEAKARNHSVLYMLTQPQNFAFFEGSGFVKDDLPFEKLANYCYRCPLYPDKCNETAFIRQL